MCTELLPPVATQLQLINISYHIILYHIISYYIISTWRVKSEVIADFWEVACFIYSWYMYQGFGRTRKEPVRLHSVVP
jgi:hypothetical protein